MHRFFRFPLVLLALASAAHSQSYVIRTFAGGGLPPDTFGYWQRIAIDRAGNIFVALSEYAVVVRVDSTGALTVVAGNGKAGFSGDNGPATAAQLNYPVGVALDSSGNLYI